MTLLIGITIGAMFGFVFGLFMSGTVTQVIPKVIPPPTSNPSQMFGVPRLEPVTTTIVGCIAAIGIGLLYLYITEWSKSTRVPKEKALAKGAE
jgi:hypothetical protein